ncbi:MAG TPA: zinc-ribbon domain-containing protein [Streptosporangiaceae bacterium]|jgi:hypothetical protein|nr:zinc-ribbon domain-containing protein [Streptosporangiaceae bacterium]
MSFCTRCGREIRGETAFCTGCGTELPLAARDARPPARAGGEPRGNAATVVVALPPDPDLVQSGSRGPRSRGRAILAAAAVVVVVAGGGVTAWRLADSRTVTAAPAGRTAAASRPPSAPPSTLPGSAGPSTAPSPVLPATGAAGVPVAAAAAQQPGAGQVAAFVARYFAAINHRDYPAYVALFAPGGQPVPSRQQFLSGYQSTVDSAAALAGLTPTATGWAARVTFVSHQDPARSATGSACTSWGITLFLAADGSAYLIEAAPPGYHASDTSCS